MRNPMLVLVASACFMLLLCNTAMAQGKCLTVGGSIVTNFVDSADTLGTATGDLAGGLGVHVLAQDGGPGGSIVINVQHHWVTAAGDTIALDHATVTLFPTSVPGFYAASYLNGIAVNRLGTGRFAGARGKLYGWGAADLNQGSLVLRYSGQVCRPD